MYILGDFNLTTIDWELQTNTTPNEAGTMLLQFMDTNFLAQVVNKPTRLENILDLVFTNKLQYIVETNVDETKLSDHNLVEVLLGYNPLHSPIVNKIEDDKYSFRAIDCHNTDFEAMNEELSSVNWDELHDLCENDNDDDGSQFLELFRLTVLQITLKHAPVKHRSQKNRKTRKIREKYKFKRRRRKLNARIRALKKHNPTSLNLPKLVEEVKPAHLRDS